MILIRAHGASIDFFVYMKYLIGTKQGMTQRFLDDGSAVAVSVVAAGPCHVTTVKTQGKDGYEAVQLGYGPRKKLSKPEKGHLKKLPQYGTLYEFPQKKEALSEGQELTVAQFAKGDEIKVTGTSKGKGFQGVVKRHGFRGSHASHGHKDQLRMPGSIGSTGPARVLKNMRMAGRMGAEKVTSSHLEIIDVLPEENILFIKGAIPGPTGSTIFLFSESETQGTEVKKKEETQGDAPEQKAPDADQKKDKEKFEAAPEKEEQKKTEKTDTTT